MSRHRFFLQAPLPAASGRSVVLPLSREDVHHAVSVLRVRPGEEIEVAEPGGDIWVVEIAEAGHEVVRGVPVERLPVGMGSEPDVVLVQGVAKGEKMDDIVRHAVEVGATRVVPVLFNRCVVKLDASKRAERGDRWRRIAKSAAEQAHRGRVPEVSDPVEPRELPALLADADVVVVLWEEAAAEGQGVASVLAGVRGAGPDGAVRVALVVGPEGGLTEGEVADLVDAGARVATLGRNVLRAETAALVGLGLVVHELGGLGNAG